MEVTKFKENIQDTATYVNLGLEELDKLILGEKLAKIAVLGALATRSNVALISFPGTGKSELVNNSHRIVKGIEASEVANIQASSTLSDKNLFGTMLTQFKTNEHSSHFEKVETEGLIDESTKIIAMPEASRLSPWAMNSLLEFLETKSIAKIGQSEQSFNEDFRSLLMAYNLTDGGDGIFDLSDAIRSRLTFSAYIGHQPDRIDKKKVRNGWVPTPDKIDYVADTTELDKIGRFIKIEYILSDANEQKIEDLENSARKFLKNKLNYDEGLRFTKQLSNVSKFLLAANQDKWDEFEYLSGNNIQNVGQVALRLILPARFAQRGYLRHGESPDGILDEFVESI